VFTGENLSHLLYAVATGHRDRAKNLVYTHEDLSDEERELLRPIVEDDAAGGADVARRLGDALREQGCDLALSNECYRSAFYLSGASYELAANPLYAYFLAHRTGGLLDKWVHYFPIYHRHLERWRGRAPRVLEIGVYQGGGLDLWEHYLGRSAVLVGADIDEAAIRMADPRRTIVLGDQADPEFLRSLVESHGPFDIVIDDGGHTMEQQIVSIEVLFPLLAEGGTYLVEDTHTSYWPDYGGGVRRQGTFIEWVKDRLDDLHAYHRSDPVHPVWADHVDGIHCYDSVVVLDKRRRPAPFNENQGGSDFVYLERPTSAMVGEMLATRDAALRDLAEQRNDVREDLRIASGELAALRPRTAELQAELSRIEEELTVTRNDLLEAWEQLRSMRRTVSWRLTTPLRLVRRGMGRRR
jgi:hypothetical protein